MKIKKNIKNYRPREKYSNKIVTDFRSNFELFAFTFVDLAHFWLLVGTVCTIILKKEKI
jgi:hypothetical protein